MNPRIVSGIKQAAVHLLQGNEVTKTVNNSVSTMQKMVNASDTIMKISDEAAAVKDKFVNTKAKSNIEKMLGVENSVANAEEKLRRELIDSHFFIADKLFKRVKNVFLPTEFPSGAKIALKKSYMNEIANNIASGKSTNFEYTDKSGATIKGFVSNKMQKQGEDCFLAQLQRVAPDKTSEVVEVRYYPKSSEIRSVERGFDGAKKVTAVYGNEKGGKILSIKPNEVPKMQIKAIGQKLDIVSK